MCCSALCHGMRLSAQKSLLQETLCPVPPPPSPLTAGPIRLCSIRLRNLNCKHRGATLHRPHSCLPWIGSGASPILQGAGPLVCCCCCFALPAANGVPFTRMQTECSRLGNPSHWANRRHFAGGEWTKHGQKAAQTSPRWSRSVPTAMGPASAGPGLVRYYYFQGVGSGFPSLWAWASPGRILPLWAYRAPTWKETTQYGAKGDPEHSGSQDLPQGVQKPNRELRFSWKFGGSCLRFACCCCLPARPTGPPNRPDQRAQPLRTSAPWPSPLSLSPPLRATSCQCCV